MTSRTEIYAFLADVTLTLHAGFIVFVVGGQLLILVGWARDWAWVRSPAFRVVHLLSIGFVVLEAWFGVACPLTTLENHLRGLAGIPVFEGSFIGHWLHRMIYYSAPAWVFTLSYTLFAVVVLVSFIGYPPHFGKHRGSRE